MADGGLDVRQLTVLRGARCVLRGVSLDARFGEVMAVLGPNGAGKSTLLRAISGLVDYTGQVRLSGVPLESLTAQERAKQLSYVPQQSLLTAPMIVREVVALGRHAHRQGFGRESPSDHGVTLKCMAETDVTHLADRRFNELSYGEQKRVLIARALCTGARVLLLDEPTASLDIEHALRLFVLLRGLARQGRCVVLVLHQLDEALKHADRAALIKDGSLLAAGPGRDVITAARVRELYGVELVAGGGFGFRLPEAGS